MERIRIINDYFIRYLFGSEKNTGILRSFVNAVLTDKGYPPVASVRVTNPFLGPMQEIMKESILDVCATDEQGRSFDIEIQTCRKQSYAERALYYWAKLYAAQLGKGALYDRLHPVIQINVLDFDLFRDTRVHRAFLALDRDQPTLALSDHFQLHFIEAGKFARRELAEPVNAPACEESISEVLRKWLIFLEKGDTEAFMQYAINDEFIRQANEEYKEFVMDPVQRAAYDAHEKWLHDYATEMYHAREEGKQEAIAETIRKMKAAGFSLETIRAITGYTEDEIRNI